MEWLEGEGLIRAGCGVRRFGGVMSAAFSDRNLVFSLFRSSRKSTSSEIRSAGLWVMFEGDGVCITIVKDWSLGWGGGDGKG